MTTYDCPNCTSPNTQKLSVGYAQGIRVSENHDISHSAWSARCAPPEPEAIVPWWLVLSSIVPLAFLVSWFSPLLDGEGWDYLLRPWPTRIALLAIGALLLTAVVRLAMAIRYLLVDFKREYALWQRSWICRKCGHKYVPEPPKASEKV
ncbi:MAG: hypothetical protein AAGA68_25360 [Pseudomonadota bacterium]